MCGGEDLSEKQGLAVNTFFDVRGEREEVIHVGLETHSEALLRCFTGDSSGAESL